MSETAVKATERQARNHSIPTATSLVLIVVWIGLLSGVGEAALLSIARYLGRYLHLPPDIVWMSPLASTILFATVGLLWFALGAFVPALRSVRATVLFFSFLMFTNNLFLVTQLHQVAAVVLALGLAVQAGLLASRFASGFQKLVRYTFLPLLVVVIAAAGLLEVGRRRTQHEMFAALPAAAPGAPNIVFIIWDTVRSTNLSLLGYHRPTTPFLAELGKRGVVFERAISPAPWTLPAHGSLFTGAYPHEIDADWAAPLEPGKLTLAEYFAQRGYRTGGFVANTYYCSEESGLHRGFLVYEDFERSDPGQIMMGSALVRTLYGKYRLRHALRLHEEPGRKSARDINGRLLSWMDRDRDRPFFAFLNYFDAHAPYLPPSPYDTMFGPRRKGRNPLISEERDMSSAELRTEIDAYDGAIRYLDDALRDLIAALEERGKLGNTIIVLTSDHGEQFGEHGMINHGNSLYLPLLQVPLVIFAPGRIPAGARVPDWMSTSDVPATIVELATNDSTAFPGASLARYWSAGEERAGRPVLSEVSQASGLPAKYPAHHGDMVSVVAENYHFIRSTAGLTELFDLVSDSAQQHNLATDGRMLPKTRALEQIITPLLPGVAERGTDAPRR